MSPTRAASTGSALAPGAGSTYCRSTSAVRLCSRATLPERARCDHVRRRLCRQLRRWRCRSCGAWHARHVLRRHGVSRRRPDVERHRHRGGSPVPHGTDLRRPVGDSDCRGFRIAIASTRSAQRSSNASRRSNIARPRARRADATQVAGIVAVPPARRSDDDIAQSPGVAPRRHADRRPYVSHPILTRLATDDARREIAGSRDIARHCCDRL